MTTSPRTRASERGSVTILVIWGIALVFILMAAVNYTSRADAVIARAAIDVAQARQAAEAGTQIGLARLLDHRLDDSLKFDGTPVAWALDGVRVDISIFDEAGKIDLNQAPPELLAGLLAATGQPPDAAAVLACRIVDRRGGQDADCPPESFGDAEQRRVPLFTAPEELAVLPGFTEATYAAVADSVTVMTRASAIDPRVATRAVLLAVPGATPMLVDSYLSQRSFWNSASLADIGVAAQLASPLFVTSPRQDFTIRAIASTQTGVRFRADLQVRLTAQPTRPYEIVAWRTPALEPPRAAK
ncbi:MAG: general secretion pathway protein GspK [Alphaproteobacteria bacterium]|nr:general secretion pathway protein GspK [Alphaproteobacteria bacterium]